MESYFIPWQEITSALNIPVQINDIYHFAMAISVWHNFHSQSFSKHQISNIVISEKAPIVFS
jgi:hypothetical protein